MVEDLQTPGIGTEIDSGNLRHGQHKRGLDPDRRSEDIAADSFLSLPAAAFPPPRSQRASSASL
jgi:hypothetical protein